MAKRYQLMVLEYISQLGHLQNKITKTRENYRIQLSCANLPQFKKSRMYDTPQYELEVLLPKNKNCVILRSQKNTKKLKMKETFGQPFAIYSEVISFINENKNHMFEPLPKKKIIEFSTMTFRQNVEKEFKDVLVYHAAPNVFVTLKNPTKENIEKTLLFKKNFDFDKDFKRLQDYLSKYYEFMVQMKIINKRIKKELL